MHNKGRAEGELPRLQQLMEQNDVNKNISRDEISWISQKGSQIFGIRKMLDFIQEGHIGLSLLQTFCPRGPMAEQADPAMGGPGGAPH